MTTFHLRLLLGLTLFAAGCPGGRNTPKASPAPVVGPRVINFDPAALQRLGVLTTREVGELSRQVEELNRQVSEMMRARSGSARKASAARAAKRPAKRKKAASRKAG